MATAIYARRSTDSDDKQVLSLPAQLEWARMKCVDLGLTARYVFEERRSAKQIGRPEFARMMKLVRDGAVDSIVCWKADRLARNALDGGAVLHALEQKQLSQIITSDRTYTREGDEQFLLHLELGLSTKFSTDLGKNVRRGFAEKLRRGEWIGLAPLGYLNRREGKSHSVIVTDPSTAPYVRDLFRLAASGDHSLNELARLATDDWKLVRTKRRVTSRSRGLALSGVEKILKNPFYFGGMRYQGQLFAGSHEPLVSQEMFDHVQDVLAGRRTVAERPSRHDFAFTGLLRCSECGRRYTAYVRRKPSGRSYIYYACTLHMREDCGQPILAEHKIESAVFEALQMLTISSNDADQCLEILTLLESSDVERENREMARHQKLLDEVHVRQARLLDLLVEGVITKADYDGKRRELASREAEHQLATDGGRQLHGERIELVRSLFRSLVDAAQLFTGLPPAEKKRFLRDLNIELEAVDGKIRVHAGKPTSIVLRSRGSSTTAGASGGSLQLAAREIYRQFIRAEEGGTALGQAA